MKIRRIKLLIANGWFKTVCLVSYSLFSMLCSNASAQERKDTSVTGINMDSVVANPDSALTNNIYIQERNQGLRARAYGPQYPQNGYPLIVLDGRIKDDPLEFDIQYLDSLVNGTVPIDEKSMARLLGIKTKIYSVSVLREAAADAVWGQRGKNGVIEVKTKTRKQYRKEYREEKRKKRNEKVN